MKVQGICCLQMLRDFGKSRMLAFVPCPYLNKVIAFCVSQFLLKFIKRLSLPLVFCCALMKFCPLSLQRWPRVLDGGRNHSLLLPNLKCCIALMCKTQMPWTVAGRSVISSSPWELLCPTLSEPSCLPTLTPSCLPTLTPRPNSGAPWGNPLTSQLVIIVIVFMVLLSLLQDI